MIVLTQVETESAIVITIVRKMRGRASDYSIQNGFLASSKICSLDKPISSRIR